jgi:hypothetical protein
MLARFRVGPDENGGFGYAAETSRLCFGLRLCFLCRNQPIIGRLIRSRVRLDGCKVGSRDLLAVRWYFVDILSSLGILSRVAWVLNLANASVDEWPKKEFMGKIIA